ncbi:MAG TPA: acetyl-CoA carboxylase biotin carboxyl carrier protein subunit [Bacilli bacterium]|nr:acetyl-CoA carboxylase biotin carboxyl carrier protein subunit [Bacilli bacterium]
MVNIQLILYKNTYKQKRQNKEEMNMKEVVTNMAGNLWKLLVKVGDTVEEGQDVAILESMKMEIPVAAEMSGTVVEVKKNEGDFVDEGEVLVVLE